MTLYRRRTAWDFPFNSAPTLRTARSFSYTLNAGREVALDRVRIGSGGGNVAPSQSSKIATRHHICSWQNQRTVSPSSNMRINALFMLVCLVVGRGEGFKAVRPAIKGHAICD